MENKEIFDEELELKLAKIDEKKKELTRTNEAQIAYHFPYMPQHF